MRAEPRVFHLRRRAIELSQYKGRGAQDNDFTTLITEPTTVYDEEEQAVTMVYLAPIAEDMRVLVDVLRHISIPNGARPGGMRTRSRVIGYQPRLAIHQDYCAAASLAAEDPQAHAIVCTYAAVVSRYYARYGPTVYAHHAQEAAKVLPDWTLEGTAFTSGIVNRDNPLPYHFDSGNFTGVWSNMLGFKRGVTGDHLSVPEYDLGFEVADKSLLMFDGQGLLHGVTPFRRRRGGHRFTIVYYSSASMWRCLPPGEEAKRSHR